jgi:hypothetical protein
LTARDVLRRAFDAKVDRRHDKKDTGMGANVSARLGALCYVAWGIFHVYVAWQIYGLAWPLTGISQGRMLQLAAYMLTIALFAIVIGLRRNWRNDTPGYWLNLCVIGWADLMWVLVVVLPGYVPAARGLIPPAIFVAGAILTTHAHRRRV